jgi:hypothetical protein
MERLVPTGTAGQISAQLVSRGISADTVVQVLVAFPAEDALPMASIAQLGGAFDWLADEPDIYSDKDGIAVKA